jgi:mannitol-1-phosphate/altronate dehydrogenase
VTAFPILQFGTSRFLQAHVDLFVSQALARGEAMGRIAVVQTTSSKESRKRLDAFAAGQRLADEEIDMRLQEAAGAELEDRECGQEPRSQ